MKHLIVIILAVLANVVWPYFYIVDPGALQVNQLAVIRAERTSYFHGGTIEMKVPVTFYGVGAGLGNDPGPCFITHRNTIHVICYPTKAAATLFVWGYVGPHTSPMIISGQAAASTKVIGDTATLAVGGVVRAYTPVLVR